ncbi:hypothetical protein DL95DRAFT_469802 [Leptodontidium sp. 2 PMI_412]|nr:hypothetical protein BKA61DRAFT_673675 [Leptodontidium sp. MPI-SDFR-AT-0119]KAH9206238.1 hypothetical protein DL95DRAFT_469802 [Leptodontidium sp. 2 PMI_412]
MTNTKSGLSTTQNITILLNVSTESRHVFPRISYYFNKIASAHSGRVQIRRLEVERKLLVTPVAVSYLRSNGGGSRFKKYESFGKQTTHDTYDRNSLLFSKGVYIRPRNGHWEAKIQFNASPIASGTLIATRHIPKEACGG